MAIFTGSTAICRHLAAWIIVAPAVRLLVVALVLGVANGLVSAGAIAAVLAAGWLATAIVLGLRLPPPAAPPATPAAAAPGPSVDEPAAPDEPPPAAEPAELTANELAMALHAVAAPHAHLSAVARHLATTPEKVRTGLKAAGIPAGDQVRMRGRGVSTGVRAAHIPPLPPAADPPPGDVVAAGQPSNNNSNNNFETVPDDTNPVRTHVRWRARRSG
ncbi:hypothetical protein [Streptomyces aculeolatus]|uniref:hypothetical protein n=1 Tax=Streptomyces aculeolatus TaxID=270689 RepID=UPI001CECA334|nr:hypothetical protein [Streptomyces aculeolatus]